MPGPTQPAFPGGRFCGLCWAWHLLVGENTPKFAIRNSEFAMGGGECRLEACATKMLEYRRGGVEARLRPFDYAVAFF